MRELEYWSDFSAKNALRVAWVLIRLFWPVWIVIALALYFKFR